MSFNKWFDITNLNHLKAYKHLCDSGFWPKGFIPDVVEMDLDKNHPFFLVATFDTEPWHVLLASRMAKAYTDLKVECS